MQRVNYTMITKAWYHVCTKEHGSECCYKGGIVQICKGHEINSSIAKSAETMQEVKKWSYIMSLLLSKHITVMIQHLSRSTALQRPFSILLGRGRRTVFQVLLLRHDRQERCGMSKATVAQLFPQKSKIKIKIKQIGLDPKRSGK